MVSYRPLDQVMTRVTSYSMKNMPSSIALVNDEADPLSSPPVSSPIAVVSATSPSPRRRAPTKPPPPAQKVGGKPQQKKGTATPKKSLSAILSNVPSSAGQDITFAAFKSLPVEYTKERESSEAGESTISSSGFTSRRHGIGGGGRTCQELVDEMCSVLLVACSDAGVDVRNLMSEKDIVR